jgi:hypothetical protein
MRSLIWIAAFGFFAGCATAPNVEPQQYLDEHTAATITRVAEPWIFNRAGSPAQLDFVHLYAIDVNRMGEHRQYLVVVKHWPAPDLSLKAAPTLQLITQGSSLALTAVISSGRELGVGQPLDPAAPKGAKSWFYPIDKGNLERVSRETALGVALVSDDVRASYEVWRDGREALSEFSAMADQL